MKKAKSESIEDLLKQATNNPNLAAQQRLHLTGELLKSFRKGRDETGLTNVQYITHCVAEELPALVEELVSAGVERDRQNEEEIKFFVDRQVLNALRTASERTGLTSNLLLLACIRRRLQQNSSAKPPRTTRKK